VFDAGAGPLLRQQHDVGFGDDLDLIAQGGAGLDGLAKQRFAAVVAVNVGVVKGGDALGQASVDARQVGVDAGVAGFRQAPDAVGHLAELATVGQGDAVHDKSIAEKVGVQSCIKKGLSKRGLLIMN